MITVIDIGHGINFSVGFTGHAQIIISHNLQIIRNIFFRQIIIQGNKNAFLNTILCNIGAYAENNIRIVVGLQDHIQFFFPVITSAGHEAHMDSRLFFHILCEIVSRKIFHVRHAHGEHGHINGTILYNRIGARII